jgi:DNA polymerase/3'-5' exonuclease PolX
MASIKVIIDNFIVLREENRKNKEPFKVKAYDAVIKKIETFAKEKDVDVMTADDLAAMDNLSAKMKEKIQQIIDTGMLEQVQRLDPSAIEMTKAVSNLSTVMGIGPSVAKQLYEKHHIVTVDDLKRFEGEIELTHAQRLGLKYYDDMMKRIPYKEMLKHNEFLKDCGEFQEKVEGQRRYRLFGKGVPANGEQKRTVR